MTCAFIRLSGFEDAQLGVVEWSEMKNGIFTLSQFERGGLAVNGK